MTITTAKQPQGLLLPALAVLLATPAAHANWIVTPSVTLRETWTDNATLSAQNSGSQWVTELSPALRISNRTPRLQTSVDYRLSALEYTGERPNGADRVTQQLSAAMQSSVVPDLLYLDADYNIALQPISAFGPQAANNYTANNRQEVRSWRINPTLMRELGSFAVARMSYTRDSVDAGSIGLVGSEGHTITASVNSGSRFQKVTWGLQASSQTVDTAALPETRSQVFTANVGYALSRTLRLRLSGGYDKFTYDALSEESAGANWFTGFNWAPSARTNVDVSVGRRYYGNSYSLKALHRSRHTTWNLSYSDDVTSTRSQFLIPSTVDTAALLDQMFMANFPDPVQRAMVVQAYLQATGLPPSLPNSVNYFSNRYMLQRQFSASVAMRASRSTAVLSAYKNRREALTQGRADSTLLGSNNFSLNDNVNQSGANASLNYQLGARTQLTLSSSFMQAESLTLDLHSRSRTVAFSASHRFGRSTTGSLNVRRTNGTAGLNPAPYTENSVSAQITIQL
jgi:uncharacterized protein (PEP-CTERM system associated)